MNKFLAATGIGIIGAATLLPMAALAENVMARDLNNRVIVTGLEAYGKYIFASGDTHPTRSASASACGFIRIAPSDNYPILPEHNLKIGSTSYLVSSLPVLPSPQCKNGQLTNLAAITADTWRDSNGVVYQKGLTAYSPYSIEFSSLDSTRTVTANACGHVTVNVGLTGTATITPEAGGIPVTILGSNLSPTLAVPICSKGISYLPETATGGGGGGVTS